MTAPSIQFKQVTKSFFNDARGRVHALLDADITCPTGRITCVLGPSGCGKTTLLRLAAGLDIPARGQVLVRGSAVDGPPRGVGMLSQEGNLLPWRRVANNIELGLELRGVKATERRQRSLSEMRRMGLGDDVADCYPHELSGGMRRRAALARVLCSDPDILLMDEPLSSLDEPTRHELQQLLWQLCRADGITLLLVTHDLEEAVFMADHLVLMTPGMAPRTLELPPGQDHGGGDATPRDRLSESFARRLLEVRRQVARG